MNRIVVIILVFYSTQIYSQKFMCNDGEISFFSSAPMEDISAVNNNVSAVYDVNTGDIVFRLKIKDFKFPKKLMQEHFNENYLESDIYPRSNFSGKITHQDLGKVQVKGDLNIHGVINKISVLGTLKKESDKVNMSASFIINLKDYNIDIPRIVMYKIAENIEINVNIELTSIK